MTDLALARPPRARGPVGSFRARLQHALAGLAPKLLTHLMSFRTLGIFGPASTNFLLAVTMVSPSGRRFSRTGSARIKPASLRETDHTLSADGDKIRSTNAVGNCPH